MYAQWQENTQPQYTIYFNRMDGSVVEAITANVGTPVSQPADPEWEGYSFTGWFSEPYGGTPYAWPYTATGNVMMYAQWQENATPPAQYTITFDSRGGSTVGAITANAGAPVAQPADPERGDYSFTGWFNAPSGGMQYAWPYTLTWDVMMYAQWQENTTPPAQYTITFDSRGGSTVGAIMANEGAPVAKPENPTRTGYTFNGWYNAANGGTAYTWPYTLTGNVTMHAQWTVTTYTISFNSRGGSDAGAIAANAGTPVAKPVDPTRAGYTFNGWYDTANGGTAHTWPYTLTGNVTMHAQWTAISYNITYNNLNGASNANPANYTIEDSAITLTTLTLANYQFGGWYESPTFSGTPVTSISAGSMGDKTFYAKWHSPAPIQITLQPQPDNPILSNVSIFVDDQAQFSAAGTGYASWQWRWNGTLIDGANLDTYTLAANSEPAGVYELSVEVITDGGQTLSARCRVTIKAK
jgi:uncharacterized repeat protein (TIGR02543 family)